MRTSKIAIFIRATVIVFVIYMMMAWAWNSMTNTQLLEAIGNGHQCRVSQCCSLVASLGRLSKVGMALIYGRSQQYHAYRRGGGDPYFDSLPWPFNPDSRQVRETGMAEPRTSFRSTGKLEISMSGLRSETSINGLCLLELRLRKQMEIAATYFQQVR